MPFYCENNYYHTRPLYGYGSLCNNNSCLNPSYPFYAAFSTNSLVGDPIQIPFGYMWSNYGWVNYQ